MPTTEQAKGDRKMPPATNSEQNTTAKDSVYHANQNSTQEIIKWLREWLLEDIDQLKNSLAQRHAFVLAYHWEGRGYKNPLFDDDTSKDFWDRLHPGFREWLSANGYSAPSLSILIKGEVLEAKLKDLKKTNESPIFAPIILKGKDTAFCVALTRVPREQVYPLDGVDLLFHYEWNRMGYSIGLEYGDPDAGSKTWDEHLLESFKSYLSAVGYTRESFHKEIQAALKDSHDKGEPHMLTFKTNTPEARKWQQYPKPNQ